MDNKNYDSPNVGIDSSISMSGDINFPPYEELDYALTKMKNLIDTYGQESSFISDIKAFDTYGLDLNGVDAGIQSQTSNIINLVNNSSPVYETYSILKDVETKLRKIDEKYDLYLSLGYLNSIDEFGNIDILGADISEKEQAQIIEKIKTFTNDDSSNYAINTNDESKILNTAINTTLTLDSDLEKSSKWENIINQLVTNYAGVTCFKRNDGGLFIQKGNEYTIGIPVNFNYQPMNVVIFFDDAESNKNNKIEEFNDSGIRILDRSNYRYLYSQADVIMNNNADTIVATSYFGTRDEYVLEMLDIMKELDITSQHTIVSGFSAGGNLAITTTETILNNYSNLGVPEILLLDSNHLYQINNNVFATIGDNGVKCTALNSLSERYVNEKYHFVYDNNIDFSVIHPEREAGEKVITWHVDHKLMAFDDNIYGYLLGETEAPLSSSLFDDVPYSYLHYNPDTNKLE